jgi:hypothetical protein
MTQQSLVQAVEKLILTRLLVARPKGATAQQVKKDLTPLVEHQYAGATWETVFQDCLQHLNFDGKIEFPRLVQVGKKKASSQTFVLTSKGEQEAYNYLGVQNLPFNTKWLTIRNSYLPALALSVSPTVNNLKQLGTLGGLQGAVIRKTFGIQGHECPTVKQAVDALLWKQLGFSTDKPFSLKAVQELLLNRLMGGGKEFTISQLKKMIPAKAVSARSTNAGELRLAILRRLFEVDELKPTVVERPHFDLKSFADKVMEASRSCQNGRFGPDKVFISHVWSLFKELYPNFVINETDFKKQLVEANRVGLLNLSRADLIQAMNTEDVTKSETRYLNAIFHFIRL